MGKDQYIKINADKAEVQLEVLILESEASKIAYCPVLELSTYGDLKEDIEKLFEENLEIFFEETCKNGTLEYELIRLNWKLIPGKYEPQENSHKEPDKESGIITDRITFKHQFSIPVYCVA